jgi:hypothetical protein
METASSSSFLRRLADVVPVAELGSEEAAAFASRGTGNVRGAIDPLFNTDTGRLTGMRAGLVWRHLSTAWNDSAASGLERTCKIHGE